MDLTPDTPIISCTTCHHRKIEKWECGLALAEDCLYKTGNAYYLSRQPYNKWPKWKPNYYNLWKPRDHLPEELFEI
jgi:hypothetical protein